MLIQYENNIYDISLGFQLTTEGICIKSTQEYIKLENKGEEEELFADLIKLLTKATHLIIKKEYVPQRTDLLAKKDNKVTVKYTNEKETKKKK